VYSFWTLLRFSKFTRKRKIQKEAFRCLEETNIVCGGAFTFGKGKGATVSNIA